METWIKDQAENRPGGETALHLFAKRVIQDSQALRLPPVIAKYGGASRQIFPAKDIPYSAARSEVVMQGLRPDIVVDTPGKPLLIEILVTNGCSDRKLALIRERRLPAMEIDLSAVSRMATPEAQKDAILRHAPRSWLYNQFIEDGITRLRAEIARQRTIDLIRVNDAIREWATKISQCFLAPGPINERGPAYEHIKRAGLSEASGLRVPGDACFSSDPRDWQAALLDRFLLQPGFVWIDPGQATAFLVREGHLKRAFSEMLRQASPAILEGLAQRLHAFRTPNDVVRSYFGRLVELGMLTPCQAGFRPNPAPVDAARRRLAGQPAAGHWISTPFQSLDNAVRDGDPASTIEYWRSRLIHEATCSSRFRSRDHADLWVTTTHPALGNRRPIEYCVDAVSHRRCADLLNQRPNRRTGSPRL